jgi:hypothetical protein
MKHSGIIAIGFIVGCATGGVAAHLVVPRVRAGTAPTRWEYQLHVPTRLGGSNQLSMGSSARRDLQRASCDRDGGRTRDIIVTTGCTSSTARCGGAVLAAGGAAQTG